MPPVPKQHVKLPRSKPCFAPTLEEWISSLPTFNPTSSPTSAYYYLGIDPGASGGIALTSTNGYLLTLPIPTTEKDIWEALWYISPRKSGLKVSAVIEQVQGYIGSAQPGSSAFKFGVSYGGLRMALLAAGIPFTAVTPTVWQRGVGITARAVKKRKKGAAGKVPGTVATGETQSQFKTRLKARAQQLYPNAHITLDVADAILLATYCLRKETSRVP